jgi:hypothetical protein
LEFDIDGEEWDDSEEEQILTKFALQTIKRNDEEFIDEEPPYLEHALDESLEDHTPPRKEPKEEIYEEGYQTLEEEQESPHDSIESNKDLIKEREPKEVTHEEDHQVHKVEHELPCEPIEEHFDEAHHVEDPNHKEAPHEDKTSYLLLYLMKMKSSKLPFLLHMKKRTLVSCTPFQVFDVASFHDLESEEVLEEPLRHLRFLVILSGGFLLCAISGKRCATFVWCCCCNC